MFNLSEMKQGLIAAVAALVLTVTTVGAAVGPAVATADSGTVVAAVSVDGTLRG